MKEVPASTHLVRVQLRHKRQMQASSDAISLDVCRVSLLRVELLPAAPSSAFRARDHEHGLLRRHATPGLSTPLRAVEVPARPEVHREARHDAQVRQFAGRRCHSGRRINLRNHPLGVSTQAPHDVQGLLEVLLRHVHDERRSLQDLGRGNGLHRMIILHGAAR